MFRLNSANFLTALMHVFGTLCFEADMQMLIVKQPEGEMRVFDLYGEDVAIGRDRAQDMQLAHQSLSLIHI